MQPDWYNKLPKLDSPAQDKNKDPIYPLDTVVRIKKTGQFALITFLSYLNGGNFYYYLGKIEGRGEGNYTLFHDDIELECLPLGSPR